jgi:hypothetical protein
MELQSLNVLASFVPNMLCKQMIFAPALNDASIVFPSLFARPTWASSSRSTQPRPRRPRLFVESLQQRSRGHPCPLIKHSHPPAHATAELDATGTTASISSQLNPNTNIAQ